MQSRSRDTDIEKKCMDIKGEESVRNWEIGVDIYIYVCVCVCVYTYIYTYI